MLTPITDTEHTFSVSTETEEKSLVHRVVITEVLSPGDPRGNSPEFYKAKLAEIQGLKDNGTWDEVWEKDIPPLANKMRSVRSDNKEQRYSGRGAEGSFCRPRIL
jgi:hypothetical protein